MRQSLGQLLGQVHEAVIAADLDGRITVWNAGAERLYGYTEAEALGQSISLMRPDDMGPADPQALLARLLEDGAREVEERRRRKDGTEIWVHISHSILRDEDAQPVGIMGFALDITARRKAEQALRDSEARLRAFLDANPDIVFRVDRGGRYLDFHAPDPSLLAVSPDDIVGHYAGEFFGPDFARASQQHIDKALETGETSVWEYRLAVHGVEREFEARFVPARDNEVVVTIRDITNRAELEREVIAIGETERKRIGHDLHDGLGQTLTGVSLGLKALSRKLVQEGSPHVQDARNLLSLVQKAIGDTGRVARLLSPGLVGEMGLSKALKGLAQEVNDYSNVACRAQCSEQDECRDADLAMHLYRIAQEAVNNALKHGHARHIELRYGCEGKRIRLEVLDDGVGLPPEQERAEGVGLRSMRYRARMIRGQLDVMPRPGGGTQVLCTCPC